MAQTPIMCKRTGCTNEAKYKIGIEARVHPGHNPAVIQMDLYCCETHKPRVITDVFEKEEWEKVGDAFTRVGRARPTMLHSKIVLTPLQ